MLNSNAVPQHSETETRKLETSQKIHYRSPQVIAIGKAMDLLQSGRDGKRQDGYTGDYWNGEG